MIRILFFIIFALQEQGAFAQMDEPQRWDVFNLGIRSITIKAIIFPFSDSNDSIIGTKEIRYYDTLGRVIEKRYAFRQDSKDSIYTSESFNYDKAGLLLGTTVINSYPYKHLQMISPKVISECKTYNQIGKVDRTEMTYEGGIGVTEYKYKEFIYRNSKETVWLPIQMESSDKMKLGYREVIDYAFY